jgi:hypothetical protein
MRASTESPNFTLEVLNIVNALIAVDLSPKVAVDTLDDWIVRVAVVEIPTLTAPARARTTPLKADTDIPNLVVADRPTVVCRVAVTFGPTLTVDDLPICPILVAILDNPTAIADV